ncbi:hypothetical protein EMCRGX_G010548 [Ephydatia muelleri]
MRALARIYVWWPNIDEDIERYVKRCHSCQENRQNEPETLLYSWNAPTEPWARIHIDYAGPFEGKYWLVVIDAYSKWLEIVAHQSITTLSTIKSLREIFSRFGVPKIIVSDNGTQFASKKFEAFCYSNNIIHAKSTPYHPKTNGLAERAVRTFKERMKASKGSAADWELRLQRENGNGVLWDDCSLKNEQVHGRATVTEAHIRKWFADIETYRVEEERAGDVLLDPHRVFNFDESHFLLAKKRGTVLGPVNYKNFLKVSKENDKEGLTVLIGYSANGSLAPPMIVYSYKQNILCDVIESVGSVDPSWALGSEAFLGLLKAAPYLITLLSNVVLQSIFHALRNNEILQGGGEHSNHTWRETNRTGDYTRNPLNWIKQLFS